MESETDQQPDVLDKENEKYRALLMRVGGMTLAAAFFATAPNATKTPDNIEITVEKDNDDDVIHFKSPGPVFELDYGEPEESKPSETEEPSVEEPTKSVPNSAADVIEPDPDSLKPPISAPDWEGSVLNPYDGLNHGPSGEETFYNDDIDYVVGRMRRKGNTDTYWIREDGVRMLGDYVMVAANLDVHPRGSFVKTSLGTGIVCDTGGFAKDHPQRLDIATVWKDPRKQ